VADFYKSTMQKYRVSFIGQLILAPQMVAMPNRTFFLTVHHPTLTPTTARLYPIPRTDRKLSLPM